MAFNNYIKNILGVDVRVRYSDEDNEKTYDPFENPIIHKQLNGREIVPLDLTKLWGK